MDILTSRPPFPLEFFSHIRNRALAETAKPSRWRVSEWHLRTRPRLIELMGCPMYYAKDTSPLTAILETDKGDYIDTIGFGED